VHVRVGVDEEEQLSNRGAGPALRVPAICRRPESTTRAPSSLAIRGVSSVDASSATTIS
jgi:hypothetical protein